jgi:uncharacterized protein (TIGR02271 family)
MADIQHGWDVYGSDEEKVGNVSEVRSDYIVAHKGFFFPKDLYIPTSAIARIEHDRVYLNVAKADVENQGWDTAERRTERAGSRGDTDNTMHLHEEQLQVNKRRQQSGEARIGKEVVEEQQTINVPVTHEEAYVERVPGDRQPDSHSLDESAGEKISVPLSEEKVNVEKVPVTTEEVRVGKREVTENRQITDTVRREQAHIENEGNTRINGDAETTERGKL